MRDAERYKAQWVEYFKFYGGKQWSDPPPTEAEIEAAWQEYGRPAWIAPPTDEPEKTN